MARPPRRSAGFTLIEATVALVILATALIGFYELLSGFLNGANRLQLAATADDHRINAVELASTLNPMATPEGSFNLDTYRIQWRSQPLTAIGPSSLYPAGVGVFKVALYQVTLSFPDDAAIEPVVVTKLGYSGGYTGDLEPSGGKN